MAQSFANIYRGGVATTSEIPLLYLTESNRGFFGMMLQPPFKISRSAYAITPWIFEYFLDGQSARPIVFSMMPGSYCRRRSRNINSLSYLLLSTRIDPCPSLNASTNPTSCPISQFSNTSIDTLDWTNRGGWAGLVAEGADTSSRILVVAFFLGFPLSYART